MIWEGSVSRLSKISLGYFIIVYIISLVTTSSIRNVISHEIADLPRTLLLICNIVILRLIWSETDRDAERDKS